MTRASQLELKILYQKTTEFLIGGNYLRYVKYIRQDATAVEPIDSPVNTSIGVLVAVGLTVPASLTNMENETMRVEITNYNNTYNLVTDLTCFLVVVNIV